MIELKDWTMRIWVRDMRYKEKERLLNTYSYKNQHEQWMKEEVRDLQAGLYPKPKYRIEINPSWVTVKNLMTGKDVTISADDKGGPCDPSMERYWSM